MYSFLLSIHSALRWLVVLSLAYALYRAAAGCLRGTAKADHTARRWTVSLAHLQLAVGMYFYTQSPAVRSFWRDPNAAFPAAGLSFFALVHPLAMLTGIAVLTIGSAKARRQAPGPAQSRTVLVWFTVALLIIIAAIPWPFSPLSQRPYLR